MQAESGIASVDAYAVMRLLLVTEISSQQAKVAGLRPHVSGGGGDCHGKSL
jgi:hypothetical protein